MYRGRRLRQTGTLRAMVRETSLRPSDLIMPYFVMDVADGVARNPISSMPGQFQLSLAALEEDVARAVDKGLHSCFLFGIPAHKNEMGTEAYAEDGIVQRATARLKKRFSQLTVITDVCLCEYTSHGHCGILNPSGAVRNDATTLPAILREMIEAKSSERQGRLIDRDEDASMETKKREGYF